MRQFHSSASRFPAVGDFLHLRFSPPVLRVFPKFFSAASRTDTAHDSSPARGLRLRAHSCAHPGTTRRGAPRPRHVPATSRNPCLCPAFDSSSESGLAVFSQSRRSPVPAYGRLLVVHVPAPRFHRLSPTDLPPFLFNCSCDNSLCLLPASLRLEIFCISVFHPRFFLPGSSRNYFPPHRAPTRHTTPHPPGASASGHTPAPTLEQPDGAHPALVAFQRLHAIHAYVQPSIHLPNPDCFSGPRRPSGIGNAGSEPTTHLQAFQAGI
jgi:hypothetical protein